MQFAEPRKRDGAMKCFIEMFLHYKWCIGRLVDSEGYLMFYPCQSILLLTNAARTNFNSTANICRQFEPRTNVRPFSRWSSACTVHERKGGGRRGVPMDNDRSRKVCHSKNVIVPLRVVAFFRFRSPCPFFWQSGPQLAIPSSSKFQLVSCISHKLSDNLKLLRST
jgi:hypothetical protein